MEKHSKKLIDFVFGREQDVSAISSNAMIPQKILDARAYYKSKLWKEDTDFKFDRIVITTVFTFYRDVTIETIFFSKDLSEDVIIYKTFMVGRRACTY